MHISSVGERTGNYLFSQWNIFCDLRRQVLRQFDTDSIHDLRVTSRRLRSILVLFTPFIAGKTVKNATVNIKKLTSELGHIRNIDEAILYFAECSGISSKLGIVREQEMKVASDLLKSFPVRDMDRLLRITVEELTRLAPDDQIILSYLSETSLKRYQSVYESLLPAIYPENVEARHALRIAIKKWRYHLEAVGYICQHDYSTTIENLKEYQTLLGKLNDLSEFHVLCGSLGLNRLDSEKVKQLLARDTMIYLSRFIEMAQIKKINYTFNL